jgi:hypothetical protein
MKIATSFFAGLIFIGTLGASGAALSADGILLKEEIAPAYCHLKFPTIREDTLEGNHPVLQNPSSGDIIDYYGSCDHDPLGKDEIQSQRKEATDQRSRP